MSLQLLDDLGFIAPPPDGVDGLEAHTVGVAGITPYWYWIVTHYPIGEVVSGPAFVRNAPDVLDANHFVIVSWTRSLGAITYDVLRTTSGSFPSGPGSYAVAVGLNFPGPVEDQGQGLTFYNPTGLTYGGPVEANIHFNNRDYQQPTLELPLYVKVGVLIFGDGSMQSSAGGGGNGGGGSVVSVFGRTGVITAQTGDYNAAQITNAVSTLGSYANPAWITSLAWTKITGAPAMVTDPTTTLGDLLVRALPPPAGLTRLPVGAPGNVLTASPSAPAGVEWLPPTGGGNGGGGTPAGLTGYIQFNLAGNFGADSNLFWDTNELNLGIGTTVPLARIHTYTVSGAGIAENRIETGAAGGIGSALLGLKTASRNFEWTLAGSAVASPAGVADACYLYDRTSSAVRMLVSPTGSVGIGTVSPAYKLDVNGSIRSQSGGYTFPDGTTQTTAAAPAGSVGDVQFNNGTAAFGASANFFWDFGNQRLGVNATTPLSTIQAGSVDSATVDPAFAGMFGSSGDGYAVTIARNVPNPVELLFGLNQASLYAEIQAKQGSISGFAVPLLLNRQGGRVGINRINPGYALDVAGVINSSAGFFLNGVPIGGGSGSAAGATGQVQFNNVGSFAASANFFWDDPNARLGIGTGSPQAQLHLAQDGATEMLRIGSVTSVNNRLYLSFMTSNNSSAIQSIVGPSTGRNLFLNPLGGNVGVNIPTSQNPVAPFAVNAVGGGNTTPIRSAFFGATADGTALTVSRSAIGNAVEVWVGLNQASPYGEIQCDQGTGLVFNTPLMLQRQGGPVVIGAAAVTEGHVLDVCGSSITAGSMIIRNFDFTASGSALEIVLDAESGSVGASIQSFDNTFNGLGDLGINTAGGTVTIGNPATGTDVVVAHLTVGSLSSLKASPFSITTALPTSAAGLATGDVWNSGGVLHIV